MENFTFIVLLLTGILYWFSLSSKVRNFIAQHSEKLQTIYFGLLFVFVSVVGLLKIELTSSPILNMIEPYSSIVIATGYFVLNFILMFKVINIKTDYFDTQDKHFDLFDYKQKFDLIKKFIKKIDEWHTQGKNKAELTISVFDSFMALSTKKNIITYNVMNDFEGSTEFYGVHYKIVVKELEDLIPFLLSYIDRLS